MQGASTPARSSPPQSWFGVQTEASDQDPRSTLHALPYSCSAPIRTTKRSTALGLSEVRATASTVWDYAPSGDTSRSRAISRRHGAARLGRGPESRGFHTSLDRTHLPRLRALAAAPRTLSTWLADMFLVNGPCRSLLQHGALHLLLSCCCRASSVNSSALIFCTPILRHVRLGSSSGCLPMLKTRAVIAGYWFSCRPVCRGLRVVFGRRGRVRYIFTLKVYDHTTTTLRALATRTVVVTAPCTMP